MTTMPEAEVFVTLGVDTRKHTHVAVALDQLGRRLGELEIPTTTAGFAQLYDWASELGTIDTVGIEGTGAYGAGLCTSGSVGARPTVSVFALAAASSRYRVPGDGLPGGRAQVVALSARVLDRRVTLI
jgi:hypothetical protein